MIVAPVADIRAEPGTEAVAGVHDPLQETQALYGERVRVVSVDGEWAKVAAVEQPEYTHHRRWEGYPGWVRLSALAPRKRAAPPNAVVLAKWADVYQEAELLTPLVRLPMGSRLLAGHAHGIGWWVRLADGRRGWVDPDPTRPLRELARLSASEKRAAILEAAESLLGDPYFWGGRSPHDPATGAGVTGVDCSGLVSLAYRAAGIDLPRDAHEQHMRARTVTAIQPADLVFLSEAGNPDKIVHVLLYAGGEAFIEAPGTGRPVHRISAVERFGRPLAELSPGTLVNGQTVRFGAYAR